MNPEFQKKREDSGGPSAKSAGPKPKNIKDMKKR
jgi:hypothetical protein